MPQLPDLVLQNIFEQSDFQDLARIACVSKHFHEIAATAHGNSLSFANKESGTWTGLGDSKTCIRWMQKNLSRLDRVSSIIHCPRAFGTEISSLLGLLPSLASAFLWDSTTWLNFDYKLLPSQLKMLSIAPHFPTCGFGDIAHVEFSSLFGHLSKLEALQIATTFTALSGNLPASHNFRLLLDPGCSCMTSLVKLTCYGDDESLIVTGPVTVFPILEECIFQLYQETATSEVLEWFENWDMAAYRAQKAVKPAAEGVEAQKT
ncbi:TPA: hypothetical protein ACH3X2_006340 [Trebouxia sp. C0005]